MADGTFFVPDELAAAAEAARAKGAAEYKSWAAKVLAYREKHPEKAGELDAALAGELPRGWDADLPVFEASSKAWRPERRAAKSSMRSLPGSAAWSGARRTGGVQQHANERSPELHAERGGDPPQRGLGRS